MRRGHDGAGLDQPPRGMGTGPGPVADREMEQRFPGEPVLDQTPVPGAGDAHQPRVPEEFGEDHQDVASSDRAVAHEHRENQTDGCIQRRKAQLGPLFTGADREG